MASRHTSRQAAATGPGMAYHEVFGGAPQLQTHVVGHDRTGRPIYQADEVVVTPATPRQALEQLDAETLRRDGKDAALDLLEQMGLPLAGGALSKMTGGTFVGGATREFPSVLGGVALAHRILGEHLKNEDLRARGMIASHELMSNMYNPYNDDPANRSDGVFINTGDGRSHYAPPGYVDPDRDR